MRKTCAVWRAIRWARLRSQEQVVPLTVDETGHVSEALGKLRASEVLLPFEDATLAPGATPMPILTEVGRVRMLTARDAADDTDLEPGTYDGLVVRRHPAARWCALAACVLVALVALASILAPWRDPSARRGHYEGKTSEEIAEDLSADVAWYAMEISVASRMSVPAGQTAIEARIENVEANHCDQKVRIWEAGHEEDVLFESGALTPGDYLQWVELAHPLPIGRHTLVVEFQGYEHDLSLVSDTGVPLGHDTFGAACAAEVTLEVTTT